MCSSIVFFWFSPLLQTAVRSNAERRASALSHLRVCKYVWNLFIVRISFLHCNNEVGIVIDDKCNGGGAVDERGRKCFRFSQRCAELCNDNPECMFFTSPLDLSGFLIMQTPREVGARTRIDISLFYKSFCKSRIIQFASDSRYFFESVLWTKPWEALLPSYIPFAADQLRFMRLDSVSTTRIPYVFFEWHDTHIPFSFVIVGAMSASRRFFHDDGCRIYSQWAMRSCLIALRRSPEVPLPSKTYWRGL